MIESLKKAAGADDECGVEGGSKEVEENVLEHFRSIYSKQPIHTQHNNIPQFYFRKAPESDLRNCLLDEARQRFLDKKDANLPDDEELDAVFSLLMDMSTRLENKQAGDWIGFDALCKIRSLAPPRTRCFFKASVFAKFAKDDKGRINAGAFYHYIVRKVSLDSIRIALTSLDVNGTGFLTEGDLEHYVFDEIQELAQLQSLEDLFYPFYVFTAVRKIFFFLDPLRKGKIRITDLVASPILREFNELRHPPQEESDISTSWFSANSALRVYGLYLSLDKDQNGMLSKSELLAHNDGAFTEFFVDRLFQENRTYDGEMDYKTFLDFVLAMENKQSPQGLRYFWKILDVNHCGYLTGYNINLFFRAVLNKMQDFGLERVNIEDVMNEIFDMVKPADPYRITLQDLINSGVGDTVVSILTDVNGFWAYDNRESLAQENES